MSKEVKMTEEMIEKVARECIDGKWGHGAARGRNITKAGYDYEPIKQRVTKIRASERKVKKDKKEIDKISNSITGEIDLSRKASDKTEKIQEIAEKDNIEKPSEKEESLTPAEYFDIINSKLTEESSDNIKKLYDVTMKQLKRFIITGQKTAAKELYSRCMYLEKELIAVEKGVTKYVQRNDIDNYIDNVADDCVCVIELSNYDRIIPDDIIDLVAECRDVFDEFYVVFTDYTGEKRSKVAKEKRDKDPILFGNIFIDGKVSPKMYFLGDWVDEYCDLTLDRMISEIAVKEKKNKEEILYDIEDKQTIEEIKQSLFGKSNKFSNITRG